MQKIKLFSIPNLITGANLFSGCIACVYAFQGIYNLALIFIILSAVFDFFDGMAARMLKVSSPIGKELDSLADDISFGFAPAIIVFSLLKEMQYTGWLESYAGIIPYLAFIIAVGSAFRLAKFNIDERQSLSFIGLPTPANALFWSSLVAGNHDMIVNNINPLIIVTLAIVFSWLLISEIPMFSLKFKNLSFKDNKIKYLFLLVSILLLSFLQSSGLPAVIGWYIILSLLTYPKSKKVA